MGEGFCLPDVQSELSWTPPGAWGMCLAGVRSLDDGGRAVRCPSAAVVITQTQWLEMTQIRLSQSRRPEI